MGQRAQGEGVLVKIARLPHQRHHEIAAADVVHQVAEQPAPERVVAHVLHDAAAVGVSVGFGQLVRSGGGIERQQHRLDGILPSRVHDRFVGQNRIGVQRGRQRQQ